MKDYFKKHPVKLTMLLIIFATWLSFAWSAITWDLSSIINWIILSDLSFARISSAIINNLNLQFGFNFSY